MACCPDRCSHARLTQRGHRVLICASLVAALSLPTLVAQDQAPSTGGGVVGLLTAHTREEAIECGRAGVRCAVLPYQLCPPGATYIATLMTPFSRIALAELDAEQTGRSLRRMGPAAVNRWGVGIYVSPAEHSSDRGTVGRVELRREGRVIHPVKATVGPLTQTLEDGSTRVSNRGYFVFTADAFEPTASVTIAFVGPSGEATCTLDRARLRGIR
jgi:hypothetical protein